MNRLTVVVNAEPFEASQGDTIASLLAALELEHERVAVELNEEVVPRSRHAESLLRNGDRIEIVTLVGGG